MRWLLLGGAWLPVSIALQQAAPARPRRTLVPGSLEGAWRGSHARPRTRPLRAVDDDFADKAVYNPGSELVAAKETSATEGPQDRAQRRAAEYLANPRFEVFSALITLLSCAAFAIDTLSDLPDIIGETAPLQEGFASVFFLVEYLARFYSRGFDPRFPLEALNVVDLVSFLPLLVNDNSYSFLRLLRVLRLQRLLTDVETFAEVREALGLSSTFDRSRVEVTLQLARVFSSLFTLLFVVPLSASSLCPSLADDENYAGTNQNGIRPPIYRVDSSFFGITVRGHTHSLWRRRDTLSCLIDLLRPAGVGPHLRGRVRRERANL